MQLLKFIIFLIPFFKPSYILQISWLNNIYNVSQMLISVIIIIAVIGLITFGIVSARKKTN